MVPFCIVELTTLLQKRLIDIKTRYERIKDGSSSAPPHRLEERRAPSASASASASSYDFNHVMGTASKKRKRSHHRANLADDPNAIYVEIAGDEEVRACIMYACARADIKL